MATPIADMVERKPRKHSWYRTRAYILRRDLFICSYCLDDATHVDHVIPVVRGGDFWDHSNLTAACAFCNLSKGSLLPQEWFDRDWGGRPMPWFLDRATE